MRLMNPIPRLRMVGMSKLDIRGFVKGIVDLQDHGSDLDGGDVYELTVKHGLAVERPLTAAEIADENGPWHEYGCREGDPWTFWAPEFQEFLSNE